MPVQVKKLVDYWYREAGYSFDVTKALLDKKKNAECLFFGHLMVEKILKAWVVAHTKEHAPPIHDLPKLMKKSGIPYTKEFISELEFYNQFYLTGRYDEDKMNFRKTCTDSFTKKHFDRLKEIYIWLKKEGEQLYPQK